jgi:hypothetical protein
LFNFRSSFPFLLRDSRADHAEILYPQKLALNFADRWRSLSRYSHYISQSSTFRVNTLTANAMYSHIRFSAQIQSITLRKDTISRLPELPYVILWHSMSCSPPHNEGHRNVQNSLNCCFSRSFIQFQCFCYLSKYTLKCGDSR